MRDKGKANAEQKRSECGTKAKHMRSECGRQGAGGKGAAQMISAEGNTNRTDAGIRADYIRKGL